MEKYRVYFCKHCGVPFASGKCGICGSDGSSNGVILLSTAGRVYPNFDRTVILKGCGFRYGSGGIFGITSDGRKKSFSSRKRQPDGRSAGEKGDVWAAAEVIEGSDGYPGRYALTDLGRKWLEADKKSVERAVRKIRKTFNRIFDLMKEEGIPHDYFTVSFAGGKDSALVLFFAVQELGRGGEWKKKKKAPHKIYPIFADTGLEHPYTVRFVKEFGGYIGKDIRIFRPVLDDLEELTNLLGPPSKYMRWCCTVLKAVPIAVGLLSLLTDNKKITPPIPVLTGIRAAESPSREKRGIAPTTDKIGLQRTFNPIFNLTDYEVWLLTFRYRIPVNPLYFFGMTRVGCFPCPNAGRISETVASYVGDVTSSRLLELFRKEGVSGGSVGSGRISLRDGWKLRKVRYRDIEVPAVIFNTEGRPETFLIGLEKNLLVGREGFVGSILGPILSGGALLFTPKEYRSPEGPLLFFGFNRKKITERKAVELLNRVINCIGCGACSVVCPTGALSPPEKRGAPPKFLAGRCIGCGKCLRSGVCTVIHYAERRKIIKIRDSVTGGGKPSDFPD